MLAFADFAVSVTRAKDSAEWWRERLGFEVRTIGEPGSHSVVVAPPGERFLLHLCEGFEPVSPGNTGIAFMTDDIDGQVRRMRAAGVRFTEPLIKADWGGSAKFVDPDGNVFWLVGAPKAFVQKEFRTRAASSRMRRRARPARSQTRKQKR